MSKYETAVQRGLSLLTDKQVAMIDLTILDMNDCTACVLGQLYTHYVTGKEAWSFNARDARDYGFTVMPSSTSGGELKALTREWRRQITARIKAGSLQQTMNKLTEQTSTTI